MSEATDWTEQAQARLDKARQIGTAIDDLDHDLIFCDKASAYGPLEDRMLWRSLGDRLGRKRRELREQLAALYSYSNAENSDG